MKKRTKIFTGCMAVVVLAVVLLSYCFCRVLFDEYRGETVRIFIPRDATSESVRDTLVTKLGDFGENVYKSWRINRGTARRAHGSYKIETGE